MIENVTGKRVDLHFTDQPVSHAVAHAEGLACPCDYKSTTCAMPYAMLAFAIPVLAIIGALVGWALR